MASRPPDWLIYSAVLGALLFASLAHRENADAPPAPPPPDEVEGALLGPVTPFDPAVTVHAPDIPFQPSSGTAFSIAQEGAWVTARHVVEGCRRPAIMVGGGRAVAADVRLAPRADVAVLLTQGGAPAIPIADTRVLRAGQRAFHPGFPQARAGEITSRLLGRETLKVRGRGQRDEPVLAWAEVGRTDGLGGTLAGLSGAPVLDRQGRAIGVTIAESPRRGRIYTTAPDTFGPAIRGVQKADEPLTGRIVTVGNYGLVADELRRELRVAQVVCLSA
ncbi:S1 family peptidase [Brevundimonas lenta]|uniref:S1-C subfamily serine protease n=1 Tax=Brevundimonas lenta TaxID=424796 RepID=A0A7W6JA37_9CAUL|nr:serine protease [Brevundimonas lenta]MBB4081309.1 S1-C subfamily serine protease [Brevundimonas lenta]